MPPGKINVSQLLPMWGDPRKLFNIFEVLQKNLIRLFTMKKITTTIIFTLLLFTTFAQTNAVFIRHDSTVLRSSDANWLLPPASIPNSAHTVTTWFLQAIFKGKIKAVDPNDGKPIPGSQIYSWNMSGDTIAVYDDDLESAGYHVVKREINSQDIDRIRIQQDWYLNSASGKIYSQIRCIELMMKIYTSSGLEIGYKPFCRINY